MSMRRFGVLIMFALLLHACTGGESVIAVSDVRVSQPIAGSAQIALAFTNTGTADDELIDVSTPHAAFVEIHETVVTNGRAVMTKQDTVAITRGSTVTFRPGSLHLMLLVPDDTVTVGARIPFTLTFASHPPITVEATVVELLDLVAFGDELKAPR
jgi:periplasmic copper chaperone A